MNKSIIVLVCALLLAYLGHAQIDISYLTQEQQERIVAALTTQNCTCGCGMTIAECLSDDPSCEVSPVLAKKIIDDIANEITAVDLKRADISHLTIKQQYQVLEIFTTQNCTCGCGMTVADCLMNDPTCDVSPQIAKVVIDAIASGNTVASSENPNPNPNQMKSDKGEWYQEVVGRQLVYIYVGMGYREKYQIWLCSDGSFQSSGQGGSVSSLGSAAFDDGGSSGNWAVQGNVLTLAYRNGTTSNFTLSFYDGFLYLNETKYYRTENDVCD